MSIFNELDAPDVEKLRARFLELYGYCRGYHWNDFGSVQEYKDWLKMKILEKENDQKHQDSSQ